MNNKLLLAWLHLYLLRKKTLRSEIIKMRLECQRLIKAYRRGLILQHQLISAMILFTNHSCSYPFRSVWCFKKNSKWWNDIVPTFTDKQFKENFRIQRSTFYSLLKEIRPYLEKSNTNYRQAIPVEKRIACAIYTLGSSSELRTISHLFGIGKSTAREILLEFCSVLVTKFFYQLIKFPTSPNEIQETIDGFKDKCGYPMCIGALDGSHIQIKAPTGFETDYFNYKKYHSVVMLATVNSDLLFTYVNVGAPGRCNDASVFNRCILSEIITNPVYQNHFMVLNNTTVQAHLIADSAFGLNRTVLKPFVDRPNMPKRYSLFNYRLSRARCSVERAFGALKNRFRLLHKKMEFKLSNTTIIIKATTIIHNICVINNDKEELDWNVPTIIHKKPSCNTHTNDGTDIREALADYFLANPL